MLYIVKDVVKDVVKDDVKDVVYCKRCCILQKMLYIVEDVVKDVVYFFLLAYIGSFYPRKLKYFY